MAAKTSAESDTAAAPPARGESLRIKTLVERVAEATGVPKKELRPVVEAVLTQLGEALERGEELNLPGLGRTKVAKTAERNGAAHLTLKLKRHPRRTHKDEEKEPLAEDGEED
ncbi:MAG: HU family DNA-binding protein [Rhodobacteraceae bacterium]|jgi:nucleoid DNA-binding protein|nr:HU family DNA-binding protein [Paracoccaceae bacterium]